MKVDWHAFSDRVTAALTIAVLLTLCVLLVIQTRERRQNEENALSQIPDLIPKGTVLGSSDLDLGNNNSTMLIGLSTSCRYCEDSMPFLRRLNDLIQSRKDNRVGMVAIMTQSPDVVREYLKRNRLSHFRPLAVERGSEIARVVKVTPTVVLVDAKGTVVRSWFGLITEKRFTEIQDYISNPTTSASLAHSPTLKDGGNR